MLAVVLAYSCWWVTHLRPSLFLSGLSAAALGRNKIVLSLVQKMKVVFACCFCFTHQRHGV